MQIDFITISTNDLDQSIAFYEDVLEFRLLRQFDPSPGVRIAFMGDGGQNKIELIERGPFEPPKQPCVSLGFEVEDMDLVHEDLVAMDVTILEPPHTLPNGTRLMLAVDPNGVGLGFVQEAEEEDLMEF